MDEQTPLPDEKPLFRVWMCGPFRVEQQIDGAYIPLPTTAWGGYQVTRQLLKVLLCAPQRQARREALLERLWPDEPFSQATLNLNTATGKLRKALHPLGGSESLLGTQDDGRLYQLAGQSQLWVDVDEALALLAEVEQLGRHTPAALPLLQRALTSLNRGTLLEEEEGAWAAGRRATILRTRYRACFWLVESSVEQGCLGRAETLLNTLLEEDPTDEDALSRLMMLLHQQGMTHQALRLYEQACAVFAAEEMELTGVIQSLATQLRTGDANLPHVPIILLPSTPAQQKYTAQETISRKLSATIDFEHSVQSSMLLRDFDVDILETTIDTLYRLLAKGEVVYVVHTAQQLYHKFIRESLLSRDVHIGQAQLKLGLLVGVSQEYALPWYQREQKVIQTYNHIEATIVKKFGEKAFVLRDYAVFLAKRGRHHRVLWQFDACEKMCEEGLALLHDSGDFSLSTHFLCERAHIEATRGGELLWMRRLEEAREKVIDLPFVESEQALHQINYIQGEGYKRFAFHTRNKLPIALRERYAVQALDHLQVWDGMTIEAPGFESFVARISKAQCLILLNPDEAIYQMEQLKQSMILPYPTLLNKIDRVLFLAQQRLRMNDNDFLRIFDTTSYIAYHTGENVV